MGACCCGVPNGRRVLLYIYLPALIGIKILLSIGCFLQSAEVCP